MLESLQQSGCMLHEALPSLPGMCSEPHGVSYSFSPPHGLATHLPNVTVLPFIAMFLGKRPPWEFHLRGGC